MLVCAAFFVAYGVLISQLDSDLDSVQSGIGQTDALMQGSAMYEQLFSNLTAMIEHVVVLNQQVNQQVSELNQSFVAVENQNRARFFRLNCRVAF